MLIRTAFEGYTWYAYPSKHQTWRKSEVVFFPLKKFHNATTLTNYSKDGVIILTPDNKDLLVPEGWLAVRVDIPEGWGYTSFDGTNEEIFRHVYTEDRDGKYYSYFAGVILTKG